MRIVTPGLAATIVAAMACSPPPPLDRQPEISVARAPADSVVPVPSVINVPIEMKTRVVEAMLNQQLDSLLYECDTMTLGGMKPVRVRVWKRDSISFGLSGDQLQYRVPLRVQLRFSLTVGAMGLSHTEYQDVEASLALSFSSRMFIKNDWRVVTMTRSDGYEWLSEPVVKIRFVTIPIKPVADWILASQQARLGDLVDSAVANVLNVKGMLQPLWVQIQQPMQISSSPRVWLRLSPQGVYMTQPEGADGLIHSSVGIKTVAETFVGDTPHVALRDSLPQFVIPGSIDSSFVVNLYSEISYEHATGMTREYLLGRSFALGNKEIIVEDVTISGMDGYAVVCLDLIGWYRGRVFLIGDVKYDSASSTVSIEDMEFDVTTANRLHAAAARMLHSIIIQKVKPFLRYSLKEDLLKSQLMVQRLLCNQQIAPSVYVTGAIDSLSVGGVGVTERAIQAVILARGSMYVRVTD
jgi:hypothetical protein